MPAVTPARRVPIAIPDDGTFEGNIAHFLRLESGATYCDACLAFALRLDVQGGKLRGDAVYIVLILCANRDFDQAP